ncbi:MAG: hypothetical protein JWM98_1942 [Thermoleophilia bacterium]|nr:hypothetical protein [Thermoleophilia bacterium]
MSPSVAFLVAMVAFVLGLALSPRRRAGAAPGAAAAAELTRPVQVALAQVEARIASLDRERARSAGELAGQLRELRATGEGLRGETAGLSRALRQPLGRGQWGELQLRRVVELAGLAEHCRDFTLQASTDDGEGGRLRPDMVVNLPNGRCVVVDAKTPLDAFMDAAAEEDDEVARRHLVRHADQVAAHVRSLAGKGYARHVDGALPDLVVLFLPAEHLFAAAVRERPTLVEDAFARGVVIASPTTLLTLLHAVAQGWKEARVAEGAADIARLGRELHDRVSRLAEHVAGVGRHLDRATEAYNAAVGSLESRVLVQTRRFRDLGAVPEAAHIPTPEPITTRARTLTAPELVERIAHEGGAAGAPEGAPEGTAAAHLPAEGAA